MQKKIHETGKWLQENASLITDFLNVSRRGLNDRPFSSYRSFSIEFDEFKTGTKKVSLQFYDAETGSLKMSMDVATRMAPDVFFAGVEKRLSKIQT